MSSLVDKIKSSKPVRKGPIWEGPEGKGDQGGVTQSMISAFLGCRERFRVKVIEGYRVEEQFNKYLTYGNMWHTCEEHLAAEKTPSQVDPSWKFHLRGYCLQLCKENPLWANDVDHWRRTCEAQFPVYVDYWSKHKDVEQRTPLMQEQVFDVPYELPSGRTVRLRGKFDSVDLIGKGKNAGVYLQENKTKGEIERKDIEEQLAFDLQTMMYLTALGIQQSAYKDEDYFMCIDFANEEDCTLGKLLRDTPIKGVRYNVVRRPFSGGRGNIKQKVVNGSMETKDQFLARLSNDYFQAEPEYWFMRWKSEVQPSDVVRFRRECLDPILEQICDWYIWVTTGDPWRTDERDITSPNGIHWRHPFGVKNSIDEGYKSDVDKYIETGSTVGLKQVTNLFTELQP